MEIESDCVHKKLYRFFFIPIAPIKGNDSQSPKPCKPWLKRYIEEGMVLCMNFYVKVWKIDGDHQIGKYCTQACVRIGFALQCVFSRYHR